MDSEDRMAERFQSHRVLDAALRFLQRGGDDLEVVCNSMLEFAKQVLVNPGRVVELQDGLNQPLGQNDQEGRNEQVAPNFEGGVKADREREILLREEEPCRNGR